MNIEGLAWILVITMEQELRKGEWPVHSMHHFDRFLKRTNGEVAGG